MEDTSLGIGITDPIITRVASTGSIGNEEAIIGEEGDTGITIEMARGRAIIGTMITRGAVVIGKDTTREDTTR